MNHVMVDIETLGINAKAPVLSVGAIYFDPHSTDLGSEFYQHYSVKSAQHGSFIDIDTVLWWFKQDDEARKQIVEGQHSATVATHELREFLTPANHVWGNSCSFDNMLIRERFGQDTIPFYKDRCFRTIKEIHDPNKILKPAMHHRGTAHSAIDDARYQAVYLQEIFAFIKSAGHSELFPKRRGK